MMQSIWKPRLWGVSALIASTLFAATMIPAMATTLIATTSLPQGQVAVMYTQTLVASSGIAPYTWTMTSGALPTGLTLASTGIISGTPTAAGTSTFVARATDAATSIATQSLSITISSSGTLVVTTGTLPAGQVAVAYAQSLFANGGTTPYIWAVTAGPLPAGLTLSPASGLISGTPTTAGTSAFAVQVADSASHVVTQVYSINIVASAASTTGDRTGLCNAYFRGSDRGIEQKRDAVAFRRLSQAATSGGMSITAFCGSSVTSTHGRFHEKPVFSAAKLAQCAFDGGSELDFRDALDADGANGAWAQDLNGKFVLYIVNAGAVNGDFRAAFPDGFADVVAVILVRK